MVMRHGFLLIDKPTGMTSHDVVAIVRRILSEKSIGHLGTLDPAATGLLVLAVGKKALKVVHMFEGLSKEYLADIRFGAESTTYDREGVITEVPPRAGWAIPEHVVIQRTIQDRFTGKVKQVPPAHSAVHINGQRAYDLARQGKEVAMPAREVDIEKCEIVSYKYPDLTLLIRCSSGTYIRSMAHDLGKLLYTGAYLAALRRTKVGDWSVENAKGPKDIAWTDVVPMKDVLKDFPSRELSEQEFEEIKVGRNIEAEVEPDTIAWHDELPVAILVPAADGTAHARKVF
jgi:tRNA pseudouridine55 synthase